ncbi:MAG: crossover junction endodeoxyribonuclease RuvC [Gammaproteobacteria bacterium]|nr:crossover junction endodeoxyribonuclease RuvC [Gammaproteobacteria bacterium]
MANAQRILGIDPGSTITGWGVIEAQGERLKIIDSGFVQPAKGPFQSRLARIFIDLQAPCQRYQPDVIAIEQVFMHRNADAALKLGHARAAALCASLNHCPDAIYAEYAPRDVKQAVVGSGSASKEQVQMMVKTLLRIDEFERIDVSDALAVALCHALRSHYQDRVDAAMIKAAN